MIISGVRSTAARTAMPTRELRARVRAFGKNPAPVQAVSGLTEHANVPPEPLPAPTGEPAAGVAPPIDWSRPFG